MRYLLLLFLAACVAPTPMPLESNSRASDALRPAAIPIVPEIRALSPRTLQPYVRTLYGPTNCSVPSGLLPYAACWGKHPVVGENWRASFWINSSITPSNNLAWIIISWREADPINLSFLGAQDCYSLVNLDHVIAVPVGTDDGIIKRSEQSSCLITLDWIPTVETFNHQLWLQLAVFYPGINNLGLLSSCAIETVVGGPIVSLDTASKQYL